MPNVISTPNHEAAYQDLVALLKKHNLSSAELLAVAANMVGKLIALQDQTVVTPKMAMEIVHRNIAIGNRQAIVEVSGPSKGTA